MDTVYNSRGNESDNVRLDENRHHQLGEIDKTVATVAVVAVGTALFEVVLLPGVILGVAAMAGPNYLPRLAGPLTPMFHSTIRGTYKLAQNSKETIAGVQEHVNNLVAKARAKASRVVDGRAISDPSAAT